jgi:alpha-tubulin suppressor-like RCC1 family protein
MRSYFTFNRSESKAKQRLISLRFSNTYGALIKERLQFFSTLIGALFITLTLIGCGGSGGGNSDPEIAQAPQIDLANSRLANASYVYGEALAELNVSATSPDGGTLSYQWYSAETIDDEGTPIDGELIEGATEAAYTPEIDGLGTLYYYVVVTNTKGNSAESVTSAAFNVAVKANVTGITISSDKTSVIKGQLGQVAFKAIAFGNPVPSQGVTWEVIGQEADGTYYTAGNLLYISSAETAKTLTVRATSTANNEKFALATIDVIDTDDEDFNITNVTITPASATVVKGDEQPFSAVVAGTSDPSQEVTWEVIGNQSEDTKFNGATLTIASDETARTLTIKAISKADSAKYGVAKVNVSRVTLPTNKSVSSVTITPASAALTQGDEQIFSAVVLGDYELSQGVTWEVTGNSSADTKFNGSTLTIAIDEEATALTIKATSDHDNEKSDTATIAVNTIKIKKIISGDVATHTFALDSNGKVWATGYNSHSQLGISGVNVNGVTSFTAVTDLNDKNIVDLALGQTHTFAISSDGKVFAVGASDYGALGFGNPAKKTTFTEVLSLSGKNIKTISTSVNHALALDVDGKVYAAGQNSSNQLGIPNAETGPAQYVFTEVTGLADKTIVAIAAIGASSFALDSNGKLWVVGGTNNGQLGTGGTTTVTAFQTPESLSDKNIALIAVGGSGSSFAIDSDGKVYATGHNASGQLGFGEGNTTSPIRAFTEVTGLSGKNIKAIDIGLGSSLALDNSGKVYETQNGAFAEIITDVLADKTIVAIAVSSKTAAPVGTDYFALDSDGVLWARGTNNNGKLGVGDTVTRDEFAKVKFSQ